MELKQELVIAYKNINRLESEVKKSDHKAIIFDMMIDLAERKYKIDVRKIPSPNS